MKDIKRFLGTYEDFDVYVVFLEEGRPDSMVRKIVSVSTDLNYAIKDLSRLRCAGLRGKIERTVASVRTGLTENLPRYTPEELREMQFKETKS